VLREKGCGRVDWSVAILLSVAIGSLLFLLQRTEAKKRLIVLLIMLVAFELIRRYVWYRDVHGEALFAIIAALIFNFVFWLFIGRYNPVGSSDQIQVIGMDD
jgi:dipeptide/tripeptide permease